MKNTLYFKTEEEKNQYFPDGVPSNILAVVGEEGVLYTSSNNRNMTGVSESQGGYVTDPADEARITYLEENKADKSELVGLATESYVTSKISDVVGAAPAALDTLNELATALNDDANFASYVATELAKKADSTDIPSLAGYATEAYVATYVATYGGGEAPDMSAYATTSYVTENYFQKSGGDVSGNITLTNNVAYLNTQPLDIRFQKDGGNQTFEFNFKTNTGGTSMFNIGNSGKGWIEQWVIAAMNNKVKTDHFTYTYFKGDIFAKGIGNFDGTNQANAYTLAYVINDIQTNLGTAASVAELILGE